MCLLAGLAPPDASPLTACCGMQGLDADLDKLRESLAGVLTSSVRQAPLIVLPAERAHRLCTG